MANLSELLAELQNDYGVPEERSCEIAAALIAIGVKTSPERPETLADWIERRRERAARMLETINMGRPA